MTTPKLSLPVLTEGATNSETTANETFQQIDALLPGRVEDRDLTAPPGSPSDGDLYIVAASATGDWAGQDGNLALWNTGTGWQFFSPVGGMTIFVQDEAAFLFYNSSTSAWASVSGGGGLSNVVDDTTPQLGGALDVNGQEITGAIDLHSTGDIIAELGDAAGANKLSIRDSGGVEVARINSDGSLRLAERKLQSVVKAGTSSSFFKVGFLVIPYDCTVTKIEFCSPNRAISADAANYWGLMVENATAGVDLLAAKYTTATNTITAGLPFDMGTLHGTASNLNLSANDVLVLDGDVEAGSPDSWFGNEVVIVLTVTEI